MSLLACLIAAMYLSTPPNRLNNSTPSPTAEAVAANKFSQKTLLRGAPNTQPSSQAAATRLNTAAADLEQPNGEDDEDSDESDRVAALLEYAAAADTGAFLSVDISNYACRDARGSGDSSDSGDGTASIECTVLDEDLVEMDNQAEAAPRLSSAKSPTAPAAITAPAAAAPAATANAAAGNAAAAAAAAVKPRLGGHIGAQGEPAAVGHPLQDRTVQFLLLLAFLGNIAMNTLSVRSLYLLSIVWTVQVVLVPTVTQLKCGCCTCLSPFCSEQWQRHVATGEPVTSVAASVVSIAACTCRSLFFVGCARPVCPLY